MKLRIIFVLMIFILIIPMVNGEVGNSNNSEKKFNHNEFKVYVDHLKGFYKAYNVSSGKPAYQNRTLDINIGDTIIWINDATLEDRMTIVSEQQLWDNKSSSLPWSYSEFMFTFNESGVYDIYVKEKPELTQTIIVGSIEDILNSSNKNSDFKIKFISPDVASHQGISTDGKYYYVFDTKRIKKYDSNWNLVGERDDIDKLTGYSHSADGQYYNGKLYIAAGTNSGIGDSGITVFNAADLSFDSRHDIKINPAGLCIADDTIYVIGQYNPYNIYMYDLNFDYLGTININPSLPTYHGYTPQGITKKGAYFYITDSGDEAIYKVDQNGKNLGIIWNTTGFIQGIDYTTDILLYMLDNSENLKMTNNRFIVGLIDSTNKSLNISSYSYINRRIKKSISNNGSISNISISNSNITSNSAVNKYAISNSAITDATLIGNVGPYEIFTLIFATTIPVYILHRKREL